ncbi:hypothetical protein [Oryzobacter telluris]|uniref:hypothetical protein n=1 Tax=Oryzobacter telluris TaxID=3149179 RepID=UPI00370DCBD0
MRTSVRWGAALLLALALGATAGCGSPAPDASDHRDAVVTAVEAALGDARTATILADAWQHDSASDAYATVILRESSASVEGAAGELTALTPPVAGDALQERAAGVLSDAEEAVTALRVAVERGDHDAAAAAARLLADAASDLEQISEDLG